MFLLKFLHMAGDQALGFPVEGAPVLGGDVGHFVQQLPGDPQGAAAVLLGIGVLVLIFTSFLRRDRALMEG